jgi:hypothetical protein
MATNEPELSKLSNGSSTSFYEFIETTKELRNKQFIVIIIKNMENKRTLI